jgi:hypothetical protein
MEFFWLFQGVRSTGFQSRITGDESRLFLHYPRDSICGVTNTTAEITNLLFPMLIVAGGSD